MVRSLGPACLSVMGNTEEWLPVGPPAGEGADAERRAAIRKWWEWTIKRLDAEDISWVESLPLTRVIELGHGSGSGGCGGGAGAGARVKLLGVHATPHGFEYEVMRPDASEERLADAFGGTGDYTHVACAHIHLPYLRMMLGSGTAVFNCGSTGRPIDRDPRAAYAILELDDVAGGLGASTAVQFRRVAYDIDATARLAEERDFPWGDEYVSALRRGINF